MNDSFTGAILATLSLPIMASLPAQSTPRGFRQVASLNVDGVAEIVDATRDGKALLFSNSAKSEIGVVDIANPRKPKLLQSVAVKGEPTSVAVAGKYALATVWADKHEEGKPAPKFLPGKLYVMDVSKPSAVQVLGAVDIGWHPDSIKATFVRGRLVAVVAIENEPVILDAAGLVTDNDIPGHPNDVSPAGLIQVVDVDLKDVNKSKVVDVKIPAAVLAKAGCLFTADPQPEFVDIHGNLATVTLQENNGVAVVGIKDPCKPTLQRVFSLGAVKNRKADLTEDDDIRLVETCPGDVDGVKHPKPKDGAGNPVPAGSRFPDALALSPDGSIIYTADEGELNFTGGRGCSAWTLDGKLVWNDKGLLEQVAKRFSHYPEGRSENNGIEIEGVTTARFGKLDLAMFVSERGSFMALFDISKPRSPRLMQILPTGVSPEGVLAIEKRRLIVTADEVSGTITIFGGSKSRVAGTADHPTLYSRRSSWAAISGMTSGRWGEYLWGVPDNAMPTSIYMIRPRGPWAKVQPLVSVRKGRVQQRYDGEGIARDTSILAPWWWGGWWLAVEGNAKTNPNLLVQVALNGQVRREIQLPSSIDPAADPKLPGKATGPAGKMKIRKNGFEGVALTPDGRHAVAAIQRDFSNEFPTGKRYARIARYDLRQLRTSVQRKKLCKGLRCGGDWDMFYYPLDSNDGDNWAGLSEIISIGKDQFLVIERDKGLGLRSKLKKLYAFSLAGLKPDTDGKPDVTDTIKKVFSLDVLDTFSPFEKIEGLALTRRGQLWIGLDNDGGEVESRLIRTGRFRNPLRNRK